jgi:hypothetical protein
MKVAVKIFHILFFFLMLFQVAGICYRNNSPSIINSEEISYSQSFAHQHDLYNFVEASQMNGVLYSPETILLSDAVLSPIPSFQFGFIVVLGCFLFVLFSLNSCTQAKTRPFFFTNSYFHTLFLSVILINAP